MTAPAGALLVKIAAYVRRCLRLDSTRYRHSAQRLSLMKLGAIVHAGLRLPRSWLD